MKKRIVLLLSLIMLMLFAGCGAKEELPEYEIDPAATTLTVVTAGKDPVILTAEDVEAMGVMTNDYSGRNKTVKNARVFSTYKGVDLRTFLEEAGFKSKDAIIKVVCGDGYTREYEVDDLYGLYSFESNNNNDCKEVNPMIAFKEREDGDDYPSPFKLVYGQKDYDTNDTQDFNMQGWATYIQYIEVSYE